MADAKRHEVPAGLARGRERFQAWRRTRKPKSPIPEPLWTLAVTRVAAHGLHRTASTLKLDYYSLKKRVEAVASSRDKNDAPFLELPAVGPVPAVSVPECVIEIEEGPVRWRVQLKGYSAADIAVVAVVGRGGRRTWHPGDAVMIAITPQMKILVAIEPADFRKGIDGRMRLCKEALGEDPFAGTLFCFRNRRGTAIKVLIYDGQGFWLCHKRLSTGRFAWWPEARDAVTRRLAAHQLSVLFSAGNPQRTDAAPDWRPVGPRG